MENNVIELMQQLEKEFIAAATDSVKFVEGNNSAGTRVRKAMQSIKIIAQEVRIEIQDQKNGIF